MIIEPTGVPVIPQYVLKSASEEDCVPLEYHPKHETHSC